MAEVFLCYNRDDGDEVAKLAEELRAAGHQPFYDREIEGGTRWRQEIRERIRRADFVLLCISRQWGEGGFCLREMRLALSLALEKPLDQVFVIPVVFGPVDSIPKWLIERLKGYQRCERADVINVLSSRARPTGTVPALAHARFREFSVSDLLEEHIRGLDAYFDERPNDALAVLERARADGTPAFWYPEATAWAVLHLVFLFELTGDPSLLDQARQCARWLCSAEVLHESGGIRARVFCGEPHNALGAFRFGGWCLCLFDTAIALQALAALMRHDDDHMADAARMAVFVETQLKNGSAFIQADLIASPGVSGDIRTGDRWSHRFGPFLAKAAEALIRFAERLPDQKRKDELHALARKYCENWALEDGSLGNFPTSEGYTNLHAHAYAADGMLAVGRALDAAATLIGGANIEARSLRQSLGHDVVGSALQAARWALNLWTRAGLPQIIKADDGCTVVRAAPRNDAIAQLLEIGTRLWDLDKLDAPHVQLLSELATYLLTQRKAGAFFGLPSRFHNISFFSFGFAESDAESSQELRTLSFWCNSFAVQALVRHRLSSLKHQTALVVLAGGVGTRAWPIACQRRPKVVARILPSGRSMLEDTLERFRAVPGSEDIVLAPERTYVVTSRAALGDACTQAATYGVTAAHILEEPGPNGTVRALEIVLESQRFDADTFVVVSMADDYFQPLASFKAALARALLVAETEDTIVSIGQLVERRPDGTRPHDPRLGHMLYNTGVRHGPLKAFPVDKFIEKPTREQWKEIERDTQGQSSGIAWECGTLVMRLRVYRQAQEHVFAKLREGRIALAELLQANYAGMGAQPFSLTMVPLPPGTRFGDLGAPSRSFHALFREAPHARKGSGPRGDNEGMNICLGDHEKIHTVYSSGCVVISDARTIRLYGLRDHLVVDSATTHAALVVPLDHVDSVAEVAKTVRASKEPAHRPFWEGRKQAPLVNIHWATPSPDHQSPDKDLFGLVAAPHCRGLRIRRTTDRLDVYVRDLPDLGPHYLAFAKREAEEREPLLVRHLIDVARLACGLNAQLSPTSLNGAWERVLRVTALFHDYGGTLNEGKEGLEHAVSEAFKKASKLDKHLLDSAVIEALVRSVGGLEDVQHSLDENINTAVRFIREIAEQEHQEMRDVFILLLSAQDNPALFRSLIAKFSDSSGLSPQHATALASRRTNIEMVYGLLKTAENLVSARWREKRRRPVKFTEERRWEVEHLARTCAYTAGELDRAGVRATPYLEVMLEALSGRFDALVECGPESVMLADGVVPSVLCELQEGSALSVADKTFLYWYADARTPRDGGRGNASLLKYLDDELASGELPAEQKEQVLSLPSNLMALRRLSALPCDCKALANLVQTVVAKHRAALEDEFGEPAVKQCMGE